jgi:hypothetical protein
MDIGIIITCIVVWRHFLIFISLAFVTVCYGQTKNIAGTFSNRIAWPKFTVTFNPDSTFEYVSAEHPTFSNWEDFSEKGRWTVSADTIILNSQLATKPFVESGFIEEEIKGDTAFLLTFNHIKRYFDNNGSLTKADTVQIDRLDYAFNELKRKKLTRVAERPTARCAFAGYIPKEIITTSRTISISKPAEELKSIFIGCYELQGTKEFIIKSPNSNHLTLNIYSNYYQDGQIRQMKFLKKNKNVLYTKQKPNGEFEKDKILNVTTSKIKRQKGGS